MRIKLTLIVKKAIVEKAKLYARNTGTSLSQLVEKYLEEVIKQDTPQNISPKLKKLVGAVTLPKGYSEEKALRTYFQNKHGKQR